jgi:hypothetical protein
MQRNFLKDKEKLSLADVEQYRDLAYLLNPDELE